MLAATFRNPQNAIGLVDVDDQWMVLTWLPAAVGLAFLVPALAAAYRRHYTLATSLAGYAFAPCIQLRFVTPRFVPPETGTLIPPTHMEQLQANLPELLAGASYAFASLSAVQLVLLLILHWNPHLKNPRQALQWLAWTSSAFVLACVWKFRKQWTTEADFERFGATWVQLLVLAQVMAIWLGTNAEGRKWAGEVFLHGSFWRRLLCLAPISTGFVVGISMMDSTRYPPAYFLAALRGKAAFAATTAILSTELSAPLLGPPAAHWLVCGCATTLMPMLFGTLAGDWWEHQAWRWPTLSMAATSHIGDAVLTAYALPFAVATSIAIRIINFVPPARQAADLLDLKQSTLQVCHQAGCQLAYFGVAFFFASAVWAETDKVGKVFHTGFATAMFFAYFSSVVLTTLGADLSSFNGKARVAIGGGIIFGSAMLLVTFLIANNYVWPKWKVPHYVMVMYACTEYTLLALIAAFPTTWMPEAVSWQQRGCTDVLPTPVAHVNPKGEVQKACASLEKRLREQTAEESSLESARKKWSEEVSKNSFSCKN